MILKNESIDDHKIIKPKHIYPIFVEEDTNITDVEEDTNVTEVEEDTNITEVEEQTDRETEIFCITAYCACEQCCGKTDGITGKIGVLYEDKEVKEDK